MADKNLEVELKKLKEKNEAPKWMGNKSYATISRGYRLKGETPKDMYKRVANSAATYTEDPKYYSKRFFDLLWENILCPASPVLSNCGTNRGLTISCFGVSPDDSLKSIMNKNTELAMLTKAGGGVGVDFNKLRPKGTPIKGGANGVADGIMSFAPIYDKTIVGVSQGSTRRGAASINLDIEHDDFDEFIKMRRPEGDINRQCLNIHHCAQVSNKFMEKVIERDKEAMRRWSKLMIARFETGEPYIMFTDRVNELNPLGYKNNKLFVSMTNICSEITLHSDADHSYICCLSSLNLARWEEWKDTDAVELSILFLNCVLDEFIEKGSTIQGLENVVKHAKKGRAIGLGVLGWHTLLQESMIPFDSFDAMMLNKKIFTHIKESSHKESKRLAEIYGEPLWCKDTGYYNSHLTAIAPTRSNSIISGGISAGIEPWIKNVFADFTAKGTFSTKNPSLEKLLESKGLNTPKVWTRIIENEGSVKTLTDILSDEEIEVFKTAHEINQMSIIKQAAQRTPDVDQSQSLNIFVPGDINPKYFSDLHISAWEAGLKTMYYCRAERELKTGSSDRSVDDCAACEA